MSTDKAQLMIDSVEDSNALDVIRKALDNDAVTWSEIPEDATFTLRRDVEYYAFPKCETCGEREDSIEHEALDGHSAYWQNDLNMHAFATPPDWSEPVNGCETANPDYAAPSGDGWLRSGDDDPIESEYGGERLVTAYRWDLYNVPKSELAMRLDQLVLYGESCETLMGYLDFDGMHPACSYSGDGMDWNMGGITPVFVYVDYVVLT